MLLVYVYYEELQNYAETKYYCFDTWHVEFFSAILKTSSRSLARREQQKLFFQKENPFINDSYLVWLPSTIDNIDIYWNQSCIPSCSKRYVKTSFEFSLNVSHS